MPYFTQVRMRGKCDTGIAAIVGRSELAAALTASARIAGDGIIWSTRGLRVDGSAGAVSGADGVSTGGFDVNSASAAWRALVIRSRSSSR